MTNFFYISFFRKHLIVVLFMMIFTASFVFAEEKTVVSDIKKNNFKIFFSKNTYSKEEMDKYSAYVWKHWITKELKEDDIKLFGISKEKIALIIVDLNGDAHKDIIATVIDNNYYCGKFGRDCDFRLFLLNAQGVYRTIESCMSIFHERPVYILNRKVNGLKKVLVNEKFILEFNGVEYCNKIIEQP